MSQLVLADDVYLCWTSDAAVFLNLKKNRYLGINGRYAEVLKFALGNSVTMVDQPDADGHAFLQELVTEGLLRLDLSAAPGAGDTIPKVAEDPLADLNRTDALRRAPLPPRSYWINFVLAHASAYFSLRIRSLHHAVQRVRTRKEHASANQAPFDFKRAEDLVRVFRCIRPFVYASRNKCLLDSLTLVEFFARYEMYPQWVLGVRIHPFRAHAWVQEGAVLLDDDTARVAAYVPILAI